MRNAVEPDDEVKDGEAMQHRKHSRKVASHVESVELNFELGLTVL